MTTPPPDRYRALGAEFLIHTPSAQTGGRLVVAEAQVPEGASAPLHRHPDEAETFILTSGRARFLVDGRIEEVGAGESITVPGGAAHSYLADEPSTWILVLTGTTRFDEFVRRAAELSADRPGPPDPAQLAPIAAEHGIELLGPPPAELREAPPA
jgi:quercetin dioxygenase-like cupin family protein